jgi:lipoprotein-anchoring transpeptidase ErfK/SrfK
MTWHASGPFAAATVYTITADGTSDKGHPLHVVSTFTTLTPSDVLTPKISPSDGQTVGVGQPIVVRFNDNIANKEAMLDRFDVTMSNHVDSAWHWFSDKEVHFRPKDYWPSGEEVTVDIDLTGYDNGDGVWGDGTHSSHFTIGDAHVSTVDLAAHEMSVTENGEVVKTVPISAGRDKYPTMTGTHIALYRQQDVLMDSSTVGIPRNSADGYYEHVYWDVAITDGGEFVHAAPWSQRSQGSTNVSHGCVNLSTADAQWFFNFSRMGDVINVVNGPRDPEIGDHGVMDWETSWDVWSPPSTPHGVQ